MTLVDLFAGPGGWDKGAEQVGLPDPLGLEANRDACNTRRAAGLATVHTDVAAYDHRLLAPITGLIASPPCTAFSTAGNGEGRELIAHLIEAMAAGDWYWGRDWTAGGTPGGEVHDPTIWLPLEAARWAIDTRPEWIAMEQVPPAVALWHALAERLEMAGYSTHVAILNAANYGVPQTRTRAILMASRVREISGPPPATHAKGGAGGLAPWVSMAEALDWDLTDVVGFPRAADRAEAEAGEEYRSRDLFSAEGPAPVVTEKARSWQRWELNTGRDWKPGGDRDDAQSIPLTEPAPTMTGQSGGQWQLRANAQARAAVRSIDEPAPTIAFGKAYDDWYFERPATTITGDSRVHPPGHKVNGDDIARLGEEQARDRYGDRAGTEAIRITVDQAALLQSFPSGYPWAGSKSSKFHQVGNAVPPRLAAHVLAHVTGGHHGY